MNKETKPSYGLEFNPLGNPLTFITEGIEDSKAEEPKERITFQQMCEHIAKADFLRIGNTDVAPTPEQIFHSSPTGELFMVYEWYEFACNKLGGTYTELNHD